MKISEKLKELTESFERQKEELIHEASKFYENEENDIEERWSVYLDVCDYLTICGYYLDLHTVESWYDDFYVDRYETVKYSNIMEISHSHWKRQSKEDYDIARNEIMSSGYGGFENDW